ncbi:hypothetical protein ACFVAJ_16520 [Agromyces sp. NPDC057679]|uniref:hypothetical protein n=1 Tax=Agromyces sp. NPDC057679 TaxID=3346207 RepID=UPI00366AB296
MKKFQIRLGRGHLEPRSHRRLKSKWAKLGIVAAATAVVGAIIGGSLTLVTSPVIAAATGAGYSGQTPFGGFLGNYIAPDGTRIYCMDPAADWPSGATSFGGELSSVAGDPAGSSRPISGNTVQQLNYILNKYGQTADNVQAAAVSAAVYNFTSLNNPNGHFWIDGNSAITNSYNAIMADMSANWANNVPAQGQITFQVDGNNNYLGTVTVAGLPAGVTSGTMTLTNGVFSNGSAVRSGITNGSYAIRGVPPAAGTPYKISANATFGTTGGTKSSVRIWYTGGQQRTLSGSGAAPSSFTLSGIDPVNRTTEFEPIVTTQKTTALLQQGATPQDRLTFSAGTAAPWFQSGSNYARVVAHGTLYGPFATEPTRSANIPAGAPVAARSTVTTTYAQGPTAPYTVSADKAVTESGYYTWVWTISYADQSAATRVSIPTNYRFQDDFGIPAETPFVVPSFETTATPQSNPGSTANDSVKVTGVIPTQGIDVYWSAYLQDAPATAGGPIVARCEPSNRVFRTTVPKHIAIGQDTAVSDDFALNMSHVGTIYWVAEARISGASVWTDGCGTNPAETTQVTVPDFVTDAVDQSSPGSTATDTITVTGFLRPEGVDITFRAYLQDQPANPGDPIVARCEPSNLALQSTLPLHMTAAGKATSETFSLDNSHKGTLYWVAEANINGVKVWTDGCGTNPAETTQVTVPDFVTDAQDESTPGSTATDEVTVTGWIPVEGVSVTFRGYLQDQPAVKGDPIVARCEPSNLVLETPIPTSFAIAGSGNATPLKLTMDHVGTIYWVAEAKIGNITVWTDGCGTNPDETTEVTVPKVTTKAASFAAPHSTVKDTATVSGFIPPEGVDVTFAGYLQPEGSKAPVCTPENLVYQSTNPHHLAEAGSVDSEAFKVKPEHIGTIFWQETASISDVTIHTGECGHPDEKTKVESPKLSTVASPGFKGEDATDTATITGLVPDGAYVTFKVYYTPLGERPAESADRILNTEWDDKKFPVVGETTAPFGQKANDQVLTVTSDGQKVVGLGTFHWVATLWSADGQVIQKGEFGDPSETVSLKQSRVKGIMVSSLEFAGSAFGGPNFPWFLGGLAAMTAALAGAAVYMSLRRRA